MRALHLIRNSSFGPAALAVMGAAFDQAWAEVDAHFTKELSREAARLTLAGAILSNATDESRDVDALKEAGLRALATRFRLSVASLERAQHRQGIQKAIKDSRRTIARSRDHLVLLRVSIRQAIEATARASDLLNGAGQLVSSPGAFTSGRASRFSSADAAQVPD